jgi:hypothetical protein
MRVHALIAEACPAPDHRQLLSLGMATELVARKLDDYLQMVAFATSIPTGAGAADGMVELAA